MSLRSHKKRKLNEGLSKASNSSSSNSEQARNSGGASYLRYEVLEKKEGSR